MANNNRLRLLLLEQERRRRQSTAEPQQIEAPQSTLSAAGQALSEGFEAAGAPARLASQGIQEIASLLPERGSQAGPVESSLRQQLGTAMGVGNIPRGTARAAVSGIGELAAGAISPEAAVGGAALGTAGAAVKTVGRPVSRLVARAQQALTGVKAENFLKLIEDPTLLVSGITNRASKQFGKALAGAVRRGGRSQVKLEPLDEARTQVKKVLAVAKDRPLKPIEALEGRQAMDEILGGTIKQGRKKRRLEALRKNFNTIVKSDPELAAADVQVARSKVGQQARQILPVGRGGGVSTIRTLAGFGGGVAGSPLASAAFSPAAQSLLSAGLGLGAQALTPAGGLTAGTLINLLNRTRGR